MEPLSKKNLTVGEKIGKIRALKVKSPSAESFRNEVLSQLEDNVFEGLDNYGTFKKCFSDKANLKALVCAISRMDIEDVCIPDGEILQGEEYFDCTFDIFCEVTPSGQKGKERQFPCGIIYDEWETLVARWKGYAQKKLMRLDKTGVSFFKKSPILIFGISENISYDFTDTYTLCNDAVTTIYMSVVGENKLVTVAEMDCAKMPLIASMGEDELDEPIKEILYMFSIIKS